MMREDCYYQKNQIDLLKNTLWPNGLKNICFVLFEIGGKGI